MAGAPVAPPLSNFSYWNSGFVTPDEANGAGGQAFLSALRKYDPSASFVSAGLNSDGGSNNYLALYFDPSKLPGMSGSGQLATGPSAGAGQIGTSFSTPFGSVVNPSQVKSPGDIVNSPVYGNVALNANFKPQNDGLFGVLAPLLPLGLGVAGLAGLLPTFGAGGADAGAAAGAGASAAGGAAGSSPFFYTGAPGAVDSWSAAAMGDPAAYGLAGTIASGAASTDAALAASDAGASGGAASVLSKLPGAVSSAIRAGNAISALTGGSPITGPVGSGSGGGGSINLGGRQVADATSLLRAFYAPKTRGSSSSEQLDPNNPMSLLPLRMMGLIS